MEREEGNLVIDVGEEDIGEEGEEGEVPPSPVYVPPSPIPEPPSPPPYDTARDESRDESEDEEEEDEEEGGKEEDEILHLSQIAECVRDYLNPYFSEVNNNILTVLEELSQLKSSICQIDQWRRKTFPPPLKSSSSSSGSCEKKSTRIQFTPYPPSPQTGRAASKQAPRSSQNPHRMFQTFKQPRWIPSDYPAPDRK